MSARRRTFALASAVGRSLGNWNDRTTSGDNPRERGPRWRAVDLVASRLYVLGDRA